MDPILYDNFFRRSLLNIQKQNKEYYSWKLYRMDRFGNGLKVFLKDVVSLVQWRSWNLLFLKTFQLISMKTHLCHTWIHIGGHGLLAPWIPHDWLIYYYLYKRWNDGRKTVSVIQFFIKLELRGPIVSLIHLLFLNSINHLHLKCLYSVS